jgi:hypothetical protein
MEHFKKFSRGRSFGRIVLLAPAPCGRAEKLFVVAENALPRAPDRAGAHACPRALIPPVDAMRRGV